MKNNFNPWRKYINTPEQRLEYLASWYLGRAKRLGWDTTLPLLEEDKDAEEIKDIIRSKRR